MTTVPFKEIIEKPLTKIAQDIRNTDHQIIYFEDILQTQRQKIKQLIAQNPNKEIKEPYIISNSIHQIQDQMNSHNQTLALNSQNEYSQPKDQNIGQYRNSYNVQKSQKFQKHLQSLINGVDELQQKIIKAQKLNIPRPKISPQSQNLHQGQAKIYQKQNQKPQGYNNPNQDMKKNINFYQFPAKIKQTLQRQQTFGKNSYFGGEYNHLNENFSIDKRYEQKEQAQNLNGKEILSSFKKMLLKYKTKPLQNALTFYHNNTKIAETKEKNSKQKVDFGINTTLTQISLNNQKHSQSQQPKKISIQIEKKEKRFQQIKVHKMNKYSKNQHLSPEDNKNTNIYNIQFKLNQKSLAKQSKKPYFKQLESNQTFKKLPSSIGPENSVPYSPQKIIATTRDCSKTKLSIVSRTMKYTK